VGKPSEKEKDALAEQVANLNQRVNELAERIEKVAQALGRLGVGTD
jgi:prefoldin subunit 5